jgi:hypothetical protein
VHKAQFASRNTQWRYTRVPLPCDTARNDRRTAKIDSASAIQMHVEELRNESEWEDFAKNIPEATFYHTIKWKKIIEKSFGFVPAYFTVKDQGEVAGICPGFITAPWLLRTYNSLPNSDYGGPLFKNAHLARALRLESC